MASRNQRLVKLETQTADHFQQQLQRMTAEERDAELSRMLALHSEEIEAAGGLDKFIQQLERQFQLRA